MPSGRIRSDLAGKRFGMLVATEATRLSTGGPAWVCKCDCGGTRVMLTSQLNPNTKSAKHCGCKVRNVTHGFTAKKSTPEQKATWNTWKSMHQRCESPKHGAYAFYGGKGISVCSRWETFENFLEDMGERPEGTSLDRKDPSVGYEPGNCQWATQLEQDNNKKSSRVYTINGETKTIGRWARENGISYPAVRRRIDVLGWTPEKAIFTPPAKVGRYKDNDWPEGFGD